MADDSYSIRRNKKVAGVDDPVIIIQRILNIFRQRHILDAKQTEDFNNMILQQPPEIRHMCNILPGGSLLQEYVDELEESHGISPDQNLNAADGNASDNILATALNSSETPSASTSKSDNTAAASNEDFQKQMMLMMQSIKNSAATVPASGGKITADANFAKEIAKAISQALAESDEKRREETQAMTKSLTDSQMQMTKVLVSQMMKNAKPSETNTVSIASDGSQQAVKIIDNTQEITKAITESQLQMAKMFLQQNAINSANVSSNNAANNIQINNAVPQFDHKALISDLIKAQSQLFQEMNKTQTKELASLISDAIKESSKLSNKSLTEALSSFQKENLKFLEKQAKNQNARVVYYQAPASGESMPQQNFAPTYIQEPENLSSQEGSPSYIKKMFENVFNKTKNTVDEESVVPQEIAAEEIRENATEDIMPPVAAAADTSSVPEPEIIEAVSTETDTMPQEEAVSAEKPDNSEDEKLISENKKKKKKKKKNKNKNSLENNESTSASGYVPIYAGDKPIDASLQEKSSPLSQSSTDLDSSLFDFDTPGVEEILTTSDDKNSLTDFPDIESEDISVSATDDITSVEPTSFSVNGAPEIVSENNDLLIDDTNNTVESTSKTPETQIEAPIVSEQKSIPISLSVKEDKPASTSIFLKNIKEKISSGELFTPKETSDTETPVDLDSSFDFSSVSEDKEVLSNDNEAFQSEESIIVENEDGEWEWEYEEITDDNSLSEDNISTDAAAADEDGEWEWEYEETTDDVPLSGDNTSTDASAADEEGEWEWEYEETTDDAPLSEDNISTDAAVAGEDGEWEWEYEEITDDAPLSEGNISTNASDADEDGEWEWEYEETTDDVSPADTPSEIETISLSESSENIMSDLEKDDNSLPSAESEESVSTTDPYAGETEKDDLDFTSLQSGSLFFQEDVHIPDEPKETESVLNIQNIDEQEIVFSELSEDNEQDEPYLVNSKTKP